MNILNWLLGRPSILKTRGKFVVEHFRDGKKIGEYECPNGIVDQGLNHLLDVHFHQATQILTWFLAIIDDASFSGIVNGDTYQSHSGWIEMTGYSEGTRVAWPEDTPAARSITNSTQAVFSIIATATLRGIYLVTNSTKGDVAAGPFLWATALFSATVPVVNGDQLKVTYTVSG